MKNDNNKIFWLAVFAGITLRFLLMTLGHNFDFESYCIVGELASQGKNIYAHTSRYNYGPVWFTILGVFWNIASHFQQNILVFRILIVSALTLSDMLIAKVISDRTGKLWGALFFLNPISLIITGYHNQFDNIAVLLAVYGILCIESSYTERDIKFMDIAGIIFLSLSLITKHILWAFPLYILFSKKIDIRKKILYAFIPPLIFLLSFLPFMSEGWHGILYNVFFYRSFNNFPLFALSLLNKFGIYIPLQKYILVPLFGILMLCSAYVFRRENIFDSFMLYTISLVCFSSAIANQYIAIPCMALLLLQRRKSVLYFLTGGIFLSCNRNGLHIPNYLQALFGVQMNFLTHIITGESMYILLAWFLLLCLIIYNKQEKSR